MAPFFHIELCLCLSISLRCWQICLVNVLYIILVLYKGEEQKPSLLIADSVLNAVMYTAILLFLIVSGQLCLTVQGTYIVLF